nr:MAG TPA: hypothetical protein [Caudoviricetes sp.]
MSLIRHKQKALCRSFGVKEKILFLNYINNSRLLKRM